MFSNKLLKIYSTRVVGILASIISYTIVIPKISSNVSAYGIYSVVVSLLMLLQFADLGFLGAGQKYAAESYARNDREEEIKILSFVHWILFVVVIIYAIGLLYVYLNPGTIFNDISVTDIGLAKSLMLIFIGFSPVIVMQRFVSAVFSIRIEDYITQMVDISSNILKITSTFYFFRNSHYDIVGYIFFMQLMNLIAAIISLIIIKIRYKYDYWFVIRSFHFNKKIFQLTKKMAMTSIVLSIAWIIYYELDSVYVSKLYNPQTVALFAIGITMLTFSRSLLNVFFSPFQAKFNHLRGVKNEKALSSNFFQLIEWSFPISILPTICIIFLMRPLIISWIGFNYIDSIIISRILILNLFFAFLSVPISYLAMAREKFRFLLISSITLPFFYIALYFILKGQLGLYSLPVAKIATMVINLVINLYLIKDVITESFVKVLFSISRYILLPLAFMTILLYGLKPFWDLTSGKNIAHFLTIVSMGAICVILPMILYYMINPYTRGYIANFMKKFKLNRSLKA